MSLAVADFEAFFQDCHGDPPFPWQKRLCGKLLEGSWPRVLGLPTASGKTAIIDLLVFALAAGAPGSCRRIAFVVDRRIVVDEAAERARHLAACLAAPSTSALEAVAAPLRALAGGESPLAVSTLRGGIPPDDDWAKTPTQPVVLLSTVDQVGSRLLFRAYGRHGPRSWPIHAGLLGRDTLVVVDEAHCSRPFCQTLGALFGRYAEWAEIAVGRPARLITMSGTAGDEPDFRLEAIGQRGEKLEPRLSAAKIARLIPVAAASSDRAALVDRIVAEAMTFAAEPRAVGVVVNRVADARAIFERLALPDERKLLLTGRTRALDRDRLLVPFKPRLRARVDRVRTEESLVVVATQCIEVGANLDFDVLVTECSALDSLRQRFGRLNRLGLQRRAEAAIVGFERPAEDDPVYGAALAQTWSYLWTNAIVETSKSGRKKVERRHVDFGVDGLEALITEKNPDDGVASLCAPTDDAPLLLPAHLDLLVQTHPPPDPSPAVSEYLHGLGARSADVTVVWRADLLPGKEADWIDRVTVQPPSVGEGCPVPIWAARRWLANGANLDAFGDVEGRELQVQEAESKAAHSERQVLRWRGSSDSRVIGAAALLPGDVVVAPALHGGCDAHGWNPGSLAPVIDIGDAAAAYRARPVLRLDPVLVRAWITDGAPLTQEFETAVAMLREPESSAAALCSALDTLARADAITPWARTLLEALRDRGCRQVDAADSNALVGKPSRAGEDPEVSTSDDASSLTTTSLLADHSAGVESWARRLASGCGLGRDELVEALSLSGWLHDVGKADPRFQIWLHGGDEVAAAAAPSLLAKADANPRHRAARERARQRAKYPKGTRHEMLSLAMIAVCDDLRRQAAARQCDWDLVLHLVASHHGFARPFAPVPEDDAEPAQVTLTHGATTLQARSDHALHRADSGVADRFWLLVRRYGWHGLAYLEAILRLADHRRSEEEERAALKGRP